jgi:D-alanine transfer protein
VHSPVWADLRLLLDAFRQLGAEPLVLSIPIPGQYFGYIGISPSVPPAYFDRLAGTVTEGGGKVETYASALNRPLLLRDEVHPSPKGWLLLDQTINAFAHDSLP